MQYTYNIVEAAAFWAGVDSGIIRERMDTADKAKIDKEYEQRKFDVECDDVGAEREWTRQRKACEQCEFEPQCPEGVVAVHHRDGDEVAILQCPQGFLRKPTDEAPAPRVVTKREWKPRQLPHPGEFADMPDFEQRFKCLKEALERNHLPGNTIESILALDLREWIERHFPDTRQPTETPTRGQHTPVTVSESYSMTKYMATGRESELEAEFLEAIRLAGCYIEGNHDRIWTELKNLANARFGKLLGVSKGRVEYAGKKYDYHTDPKTQNPVVDSFEKKDLTQRLRAFVSREEKYKNANERD